jgi:DNA-binding NarL/FixJ family response regulator
VTIRVVIADDQGMVRSGFSVLLNAQPDIEVIAEAVHGQEAIAHAASLQPDVILMDVRMPVLDGLTERESEVLALVARGMSNGEIADHLVVAEQTVKTHVSRILMKLGLRDRTQAVVLAYETGLVHPGG